MKKISEWLSDIDGHSALDAEQAKNDFLATTGREWPPYLVGRPVRDELSEGKRNPKGLQYWDGDKDARILAGYQVARALADTYCGFRSKAFGRGTEFRQCVQALREAGL